jgi:thiol-disulfide isomerase/thioredoxin/outer membrane lipoprotein-sorting protein
MNRGIRSAFVLVLAGVALAGLVGASDTTQPAMASVTPDARVLLNQIRDAYAAVKSIGVSGTVAGHFDVDGQKQDATGQFTGLFSDGKFRHEMKDDAIIGATGDSVYVYLPDANKYSLKQTTGRVYLDAMDDQVAEVLRKQDLSMALLLARDAANELVQGASTIALADSVKIDGAQYPALGLTQDVADVTIAVDPQTHLLRRETVDLTRQARNRGPQIVKSAVYQIDFSHTPNPAIAADAFAWSPPPGAQPLDASASSPLEGKPVPAFSVTGLDGTTYSDQSLKGGVYVLDFWATWCGPCVESLPHLDQIYQQMKDQGVKVVAVNQQEPKETVQKFEDDKKLSLTIALDVEGKTSDAFGIQAIPMTVVVGKDGIVRKVFIGAGNEDGIQKELTAAVNAK